MCLVKLINMVVKHSSLTSAHTTQPAMHDIHNYKKHEAEREKNVSNLHGWSHRCKLGRESWSELQGSLVANRSDHPTLGHIHQLRIEVSEQKCQFTEGQVQYDQWNYPILHHNVIPYESLAHFHSFQTIKVRYFHIYKHEMICNTVIHPLLSLNLLYMLSIKKI